MFRSARAAALLVLLFHTAPVFAEDLLSDKKYLLKKAEESLALSDKKAADFYAARYLGVCSREGAEACPKEELAPFLEKRKLEPKGFLPSTWNPDFLDWFEKSVRDRWGAPSERVREKARSFEIAHSAFEGKYFATVVAYPQLEQWYILKDGLASRSFLLPMAAFRDHPTLFFGRTLKGSSVQTFPLFLDTQKRTLHYFWKPEFHDVNADGVPELWLRFNLAWGNGFVQILDVYKIQQDGKVGLFHHFQSDPNGYARRLEDGSVELAGIAHASSGKYHLETWVFEDKDFKKSAQQDLPVQPSDWPPAVSRT